MSLNKGDRIQGSQNPESDNCTSGPKISANSLQTQVKIMKRAMVKCPKVNITIIGGNMPLLLDSSSMVCPLWQTYLNRYFRLQLGSVEWAITEAHNLFNLKSANGGAIPLSRYVELDIKLFRIKSAQGQILITQNPNEVLDPEHKTRLPSIGGWTWWGWPMKNSPRNPNPLCLKTLSAWKV